MGNRQPTGLKGLFSVSHPVPNDRTGAVGPDNRWSGSDPVMAPDPGWPEVPVADRLRSMEVRWILPGPLDPALGRWIAGYPVEVESREDTYLAAPQLRGLSVKLRDGVAFEVKAYRGSPGVLEVAGRARGRLEAWEKWSFPCDPPSPDGIELPGWHPMRKLIRRFSVAGGRFGPSVSERGGEEPGCNVELAEIRVRDQAWWTLGFEATGPMSLQRGELEDAAALAFAEAPPGVELGTDSSQSYAQWLAGQRSRSRNSAS